VSRQSLRIAVDIGGTFTDGVAEEASSGRIWVGKCLTTPDDPGIGVSEVVLQLLNKTARADASADVSEVVHGTTLVTNTLIERKGVPTGLVVTKGTADTLDIRREVRYDLYDLNLELPEPLVSGQNRYEFDERLDASGAVVVPPRPEDLDEIIRALSESGVEAVAVCLLHGYLNDEHERQVEDVLRQRLQGVSISVSARVAREIREYERMSTTVANAYVQPLMQRYLGLLAERMRSAGISGPLRIMLSSGGFTSAEAAAETPILLLESGPAAGVLSAVNTGLTSGVDHVLAFDMGGTTAKACVAIGGAPAVAHSFEAARVRRFKRGSGLPILIPSIDLIEIGAGGGSIASVDALGLLKVGPQSVGSVPGPACYGQGGTEASVTDADLVLGYLDADNFLGGEMRLRTDLAEKALGALGERLGLGATETAWGIANIVNENMAAAARVHIAEKGLDPRAFTMIATGGAGPVHAAAVARKLGIKRLLCPIAAGAGSCLGLLAAPARVDRAWSKPEMLDALDWDEVRAGLQRLHADAKDELVSAGADLDDIFWSLLIEMRYAGQGSTISVALPYADIDPELAPEIRTGFEENYRALYGSIVPDAHPQVVTWRLSGKSELAAKRFAWAEDRTGQDGVEPRRRRIYLPLKGDYGEVPVYRRYELSPGTTLDGPLVLEERESTLVVPFPARVDILPDLTVSVAFGEQQ
jgi:N-methylhydantoinase A